MSFLTRKNSFAAIRIATDWPLAAAVLAVLAARSYPRGQEAGAAGGYEQRGGQG
jgi:hypothetical protein